ncbi:hypothetical protein AALP_AA3G102900 [Arabis alpina]|uniref:Knottin scorpion toxin-like domain-containing protein n=1 Tax=Arabis alpina TaxID=50452 RepID=A0A087H8A0_ARAAL|nr:hypothetical protein AALP_AA3G102900 [Arabis alpina]
MAKTLKSISFTTLLLLVLFISAEIPKSEATCETFLGEATVSNPCRRRNCAASCSAEYTESCKGLCELHDNEVHCHCYRRP